MPGVVEKGSAEVLSAGDLGHVNGGVSPNCCLVTTKLVPLRPDYHYPIDKLATPTLSRHNSVT